MNRRDLLERVSNAQTQKAKSQFERRGVLRGALSFVGGVSLFDIGPIERARGSNLQYENQAMAVAAEYTSPETIESHVQTHASDLITHLASEGHIERDETSSLPLDIVHATASSYISANSGVLVSAPPFDENPQVKIEVKQPIANGKELVLLVSPVSGESRAIVRSIGEFGRLHEVISSPKEEEIGTTDCFDCRTRTECSTSCTYSSCECVEVTAKICRTEGCDGCYTSSSDCCGDYNCDL